MLSRLVAVVVEMAALRMLRGVWGPSVHTGWGL